MWEIDPDLFVDKMIRDHDDTVMPVPSMESEPHLLISKVRKHYMEYVIKLLSVNYENHQKLMNKNIYLPSAIWRCAKSIEMKAAQTCMVVQLYRKSITDVIAEVKRDTKRGKLNKKLYECLHKLPENEKNLQTSMNVAADCNCQCSCSSKRKKRILTKSPPSLVHQSHIQAGNINGCEAINNIPVLVNSQVQYKVHAEEIFQKSNEVVQKPMNPPNSENELAKHFTQQPQSIRMSVDSQDSDELMMQLEKLFKKDSNDDDLFDGTFGDISNETSTFLEDNSRHKAPDDLHYNLVNQDTINNSNSSQKSLDERLASLAGLLVTDPIDGPNQKQEAAKPKRSTPSKWLCEEYFLKTKLFELLDSIGDENRNKLMRIKETLLEIFGEDSDDERTMISPFEETPEIALSCKERIAPIVVKLLTPHYMKGRIRGKNLFKSLAKHLIKLIYQCSRYPGEYEVTDFVSDFLENHKLIRCEADFKEFRIENI